MTANMIEQLTRVVVVGTSGCGKSTFARQLAETLAVPHIELDALYWGPNWTTVPAEQFRDSVDIATAAPRWLCDGNYQPVRELVWGRATAVIWLDYSFPVVFGRALRRTIVRSLRREEIFAGNRESLSMAFLQRESILLWVLKTFWMRRREYRRLLAEPRFNHLLRRSFAKPQQAEHWLQEITDVCRVDGHSPSGPALRLGGQAC